MNFLSVENLTKMYGERTIFENLTFGIDQGQKVALVAKNGTGKSTLLNCLIGKEPFDEGRIIFRNGIDVGYLEQSDRLMPEHTIFEEVFNQKNERFKVFKAYSEAVRNNDEEKIAQLFEKVAQFDAWNIEREVEQILSKLKLDDSNLKIKQLSGGQKKRVALAKVLIANPDFLFLDEPTNHLDLDMIEWLEEYLNQSNSTLFMVTHDRYFLEVVCNEIMELENQQLYRYKGNFSYFLEKKAEREEVHAAEVGKARSQFKKELNWIRRQPKARGTKQKARIEAFEQTKKVAHQNLNKEELEIPVKMERLGTKIVELHNVSKSYNEKKLISKLDYVFKRKERLGIVGPNGVGKSTLLKLITGGELPDTGKIVVGETIVFGYYSQENIKVDTNKKVIDVIRDVAEYIPLAKGREMSAAQFLEKFLFPRSMHYNYVYKLSGGEKRRLKLMKVLMGNPNFLILDEPTNDLDIYVLGVLEDYLKSFQGCLIVVSHDRYFMDKMVDHLFVFEGNSKIADCIGNYTHYREKQQVELKEEKKKKKKQPTASKKEKTTERKLSYKEQQEFKQLEKNILTLETKKEELTEKLYSQNASSDELNEAGKQLGQVVKELEEKTERWMYLADFY